YGLDLELQKLVIHGMLHLLGYDHIKKQDKDIMEQKESYYYDKLRRTQQGG
ncbi:MAG: rRNA maturation RNase YbeY, partial [Candidatus Cloacimonetes bacterium]|nr:rRNA maturation RNase YbeY [Candidatus Cloacimonadota bacterium]